MKAGNCCRMWRPAAGAMLVGALAFAVSAQGGPRAESSRTRKTESAQRVTGPVEQIQVVAGDGNSSFIALEPKYSIPGGGNYNTTGYNDSNIGPSNKLTVNAGGFRVFWNVMIGDWDTGGDGSPVHRNGQMRVDDMGMMSGSGGDLSRITDQPCANNAACSTAWGETASGIQCPGAPSFCNFAYINKATTRADGSTDRLRQGDEACDPFTWDVGLGSPLGPLFFYSLNPGVCTLADPGIPVYVGTYPMNVPANAKGVYTIPFIASETFITDENSNIWTSTLIPGILEIQTGSCCFGIGGPAPGCIDDQTQAECNALAPVALWEAGGVCENPPTDDGCCACLVNADCNDGDACTVDTCNNCVCTRTPKASWNQVTECCDAATGAECTPTAPNTCTNAACSIAPNRGVCQVNPVPAGQACKGAGDDNPCTFNDVCDGTGADTCAGTDVNSQNIMCASDADCLTATGLSAATCVSGLCNCTLVPDLTIDVEESGKADPNCFDSGTAGAKVVAHVHVAAATAPINGGQFVITYDPTCLDYNSATGVAPYTDQVYGPIVDEAAGTIFTVVGTGFGVGNGPAGNADMVDLSFTKIGDCNSCQICFGGNNPQNTYLVDNTGQRVGVNPICSKVIVANNELVVDVPATVKTNKDCDKNHATVSWDTPTVSDSCGNSTLSCTCTHEDGTDCSADAMNGGEFIEGVSNLCCTGSSDWCDKTVEECWTVEVNDQVGLDIYIGLSPTQQSQPSEDLTRCIKFSCYYTTYEPLTWETNITFGERGEFVGKSKDPIKIPDGVQCDCITAWDQLHTLRSCAGGPDNPIECVDGRYEASFRGDPAFGGNWLIGGNLDGWKKNVEGSEPSLFVIDVLDYGTFVSQWGMDYGSGDTPCGTPGPNADINGDGMVTLEDYAFISMNFLASAKECCGYCAQYNPDGSCKVGLPAGAAPQGITEISVRELREMGLGDLAAGDVNGDGLLNVDDMNAFMAGARPEGKVLSGIRKGSGTR